MRVQVFQAKGSLFGKKKNSDGAKAPVLQNDYQVAQYALQEQL